MNEPLPIRQDYKIILRHANGWQKLKAARLQISVAPKSGTDIAPTAFYTFGDCLALISFAHSPAPYVAVLQSAPIAQSYRQAFEVEWTAAKEPPASKGAA